jgi:anthranilate 1,2-dioxygenase small subunit
MTSASTRVAIEHLFSEYGALLDEDRLEDWLGLFAEDSRYEVIPRENEVQRLPVALMCCENLNMLRDRIASLRNANEFNIHWSRRVIGRPRIHHVEGDIYAVDCAYVVIQSNQEGQSRLFSAGGYRDKVEILDGVARFIEKKVIVDTFSIPTLLATPL